MCGSASNDPRVLKEQNVRKKQRSIMMSRVCFGSLQDKTSGIVFELLTSMEAQVSQQNKGAIWQSFFCDTCKEYQRFSCPWCHRYWCNRCKVSDAQYPMPGFICFLCCKMCCSDCWGSCEFMVFGRPDVIFLFCTFCTKVRKETKTIKPIIS